MVFFKKGKYKIKKYRNIKKFPFETYEPVKRVSISKEQAFPFFIRIGNRFVFLGGLISFFTSSLLIGIRGFFGIKKRTGEIRRSVFKEKVIELRVKK